MDRPKLNYNADWLFWAIVGLLIAIVLLSKPLFGQLTVPDVVAPYEPIIVGCNCIIPENGEARFMWRVDQLSKYREVPVTSGKGTMLHVWAPPGPHYAEAIVVVQVYAEFEVIDPTDRTKTKIIRVPISFDIQRYEKHYTVGTSPLPPPGPGPDPGPGPGPGPTDPFAALALTWMKQIPPASFNKAKMLEVGKAYESVAAQAVATSGWNLAAFVTKTKEAIQAKLTPADITAWSTPFFTPLAVQQEKLFKERGITPSDVPGIAKLWRDTSAAIKAAADSMPGSRGSPGGEWLKDSDGDWIPPTPRRDLQMKKWFKDTYDLQMRYAQNDLQRVEIQEKIDALEN